LSLTPLYLADRPPVRRLTGSGPERGIAHAAARPSAAEKGVRGLSRHGNPTCTRAEEGRAERGSQAERSREGGSGVSPGYDTTQHANALKIDKRSGHCWPSAAKKGVRRSPPTMSIQLARTPKKAKCGDHPGRYLSKNKRRETCRLQDKKALALL
jgi:hypothetical protein